MLNTSQIRFNCLFFAKSIVIITAYEVKLFFITNKIVRKKAFLRYIL